jgi:hypothetical protein
MGLGDWLMASGDAKEANERTGKKVKLGDGSRMFTDIQVFSNNPRMALKLIQMSYGSITILAVDLILKALTKVSYY